MTEQISQTPIEKQNSTIKGEWIESKYDNNHLEFKKDQKKDLYRAEIWLKKDGDVEYIISPYLYGGNLDFVKLVEEKCMSLPGGEKYKDAFQDIKDLNKIYNKIHKDYPNADLTIDEIVFLYQLKRPFKDTTPKSTNAHTANKCAQELIKHSRDNLTDFKKLTDPKDKENATKHLIQPLLEEYKDIAIRLIHKTISKEPNSKIWDFIEKWGGDETAMDVCNLCITKTLSLWFTEKQKDKAWKFVKQKGEDKTLDLLIAVLSYEKWWDDQIKTRALEISKEIKERI